MSLLKKLLSPLLLDKPVTIFPSEDLTGTVAIVTGASRGIGLATVDVLYKKGATVVAVSRDTSSLKARFSDTSRFIALDGDVSSEKDVATIIAKVLKSVKRIDVLINNAGINFEKPLEETSTKDFEAILNTNVKGTYLLSREVIPTMKKQKSGTIINIGSKISHNTNVGPNKVLYTTTKYAIEGFSFALNRELKQHGISVTCLMPGTVNTFVSRKASEFLSPYQIAESIFFIITHRNIDFESMIIKSLKQNI